MRAYPRPLLCCALLFVLAAVPPLAGCAVNRMYNMWRDESFHAAAMRNVLVVAPRSDPVRRRIWEDSFVAGLAALGTKATASYKIYADGVPDTLQVLEAVRRDGYDGLLVSTRLPDGTEQKFVPGYTRRESITRQSGFTGAYYTVLEDVKVPSRTESVAVAIFETNVWTTTGGGRLVWSGSTRTSNNVDASLIQHKVEKMILPEMRRAGIVPGGAGR